MAVTRQTAGRLLARSRHAARAVARASTADELPPEARFAAEARKRTVLGTSAYDRMHAAGAEGGAVFAPKAIVQFALLACMSGDLRSAFRFSTVPAWATSLHASATDASRRCSWRCSTEINGHCSGEVLDFDAWADEVRTHYAPLLAARNFTLIGRPADWGEDGPATEGQRGRKHPDALDYFAELTLASAGADAPPTCLAHLKLVYNRRLEGCHTICCVQLYHAGATT